MSHTPGPWRYDSNVRTISGTPLHQDVYESTKLGGEFHTAESNALYEVCTVYRVRCYEYWLDGKHYPVDEAVRARVREWGDANARLIAAAPELLEALKTINEWLLDCGEPIERRDLWSPLFLNAHDKAAAAIAKATGGQQ